MAACRSTSQSIASYSSWGSTSPSPCSSPKVDTALSALSARAVASFDHRQNLLDTHIAAHARLLSATNSASRSKSSRRNGARPRPAFTAGSGGKRSVQPTGMDQAVPSGRCTVTRSSPQSDLVTTNGKRAPRSGWNGWVMRICGASAAPCADWSSDEGSRRDQRPRGPAGGYWPGSATRPSSSSVR